MRPPAIQPVANVDISQWHPSMKVPRENRASIDREMTRRRTLSASPACMIIAMLL